jgi:hypothetical protein
MGLRTSVSCVEGRKLYATVKKKEKVVNGAWFDGVQWDYIDICGSSKIVI